MLEAILGIDVAKKWLDVMLVSKDKWTLRKFENTPKGFNQMQLWFKSQHIDRLHACLEATGTYGEAVAEFLHEKGHNVSVVNPLRIKSYANSDLRRNKTDPIDARTIADFCLKKTPELWQPLSYELKQLQALTRRIEALERMLGIENNRLDVAPKAVKPSVKRVIKNLEKEIETVLGIIKDHIDNHPELKEQKELLRTIPGIGEKTARFLLSEVDFKRFSSARALAAHAGVTPQRIQSGTSVNRTKLSKLGSGRIRKALYFPAVSACQHNQIINQFAQRLSQNGKTRMHIVCASIHKLLHIAFGVLKHNRPFDPNLAFSI